MLRDIRFTAQLSPIDAHNEWRFFDYHGAPNPRRGGAIQYTGGSSDPSNLVRLIFERLIFDHNLADSGGAIYVDGRAGQPVPAQPSRQNWESSVALTMRSCTMFRNFGLTGGGLYTIDVWPMVFSFEDVAFVENEAAMSQDDCHYLTGFPGTQRRSGFGSVVYRSSHFDGGYETYGVTSLIPTTVAWLDDTDDPDATLNVTHDRTTAVNHGAVWFGIVIQTGIWPIPSNFHFTYNTHFVELEMKNNEALDQGDMQDGAYLNVLGATGNALVEHSRFERNGNFDSAAQGAGGTTFWLSDSPPPEHWPSGRFVGSEWVANSAGFGPAVALVSGLGDVTFEQCIMRNNLAHQGGGAVSFDGSASSTLLIDRSILESNAVRVRQSDEKDTPATVVVFTGGMGWLGDATSGGYQAPVWRIDNGRKCSSLCLSGFLSPVS